MTVGQDSSAVQNSLMPRWLGGIEADWPELKGIVFDRHEVVIDRAADMSAASLRRAVCDAYAGLMHDVARSAAPHPIRFWNYLPSIHDDMDGGLTRYMVFNAGRLDGLNQATGGDDVSLGAVATASAVGTDTDSLVIHCLSASRPARSVTNPRQVDPVRYSAHYGPRPPCFARAMAIDSPANGGVLLVGGTASILGEASLHIQDLSRQMDETLANLAAVVAAGSGNSSAKPLKQFVELRTYAPASVDARTLALRLEPMFPNVESIEWMTADLCRPELLVEIEGVASLENNNRAGPCRPGTSRLA